MNVKLLDYDSEEKIAQAARLCYYSKNIGDLTEEVTGEKASILIKKLKSLGHESPFEHVTYTFGIEGISRACSHQLVRHRIASYNQQSQRYVKEDNYDYIIPPSVDSNIEAMIIYDTILEQIQQSYNRLITLGINKEDARYVLPNACETKLIMTINARSLQNFFKLRLEKNAQWEIRELAEAIHKLVLNIHPNIWG